LVIGPATEMGPARVMGPDRLQLQEPPEPPPVDPPEVPPPAEPPVLPPEVSPPVVPLAIEIDGPMLQEMTRTTPAAIPASVEVRVGNALRKADVNRFIGVM
jgi:hypothetical protein